MTQTTPPVAPRKPHTRTVHGHTLEDPYAWLKDPDYPKVEDADVLAYLHAENDYFEQQFKPLTPLVDNLFEEMKARQPDADESVPYSKNGFVYQWRYAKQAQYRTWYRRAENQPDGWQVLLDEVQMAQGLEYFRLGALSVSPDGTRMAYSTDTNGSERFTLHVVDLTQPSGDGYAALGEPISNTSDGPVWAADSQSFVYVRLSDEWRPYQVWHHDLATVAADQLIYEEADASFFVGVDLTQSEAYVLISAGGHTENDVRFVPRDNLLATPILIAPRRDGHEYDVDHRHDGFFIRSNREVVNFALYRTPVDTPEEANWHLLLSGDPRTYLTDHLALHDHLVVCQRVDGLDQIQVLSESGSHFIEFPEASYDVGLGINPHYRSHSLRLHYTSMVTPNTTYEYDIATRTLSTLKVQEVPSGYDSSEFITERHHYAARDGVQIPVSLVYHKDTPLAGSAPLYLYAYGAYGIAIPPSFSTTRISLLQRGFVYAIAHIRGGDDLGYDWYTQGKLQQRNNTFNDFVDVAHGLIDARYASAGRIAIAGGSAGGELMGAVVNQAPQLWGAVAAHVPFVDVLNTMLDDSLPLTPIEWPEWGNPIEDAAAFELIRDYSPYDQLQPGEYPAMLVTAGLNDPRVTYWEPAKYVAKLRTLKTNNTPLLLKTNMGAGHGGKSGRFEALRESAEEYAFFIAQLGAAGPDGSD